MQTRGETLQLNAALSLFEDNLEEIKLALIQNINDIPNQFPEPALAGDESLDWVRGEVWMLRKQRALKPLRRALEAILRRERYAHAPTAGVTDEQIEAAKEYPVVDLFEGETGQVARGGMVRCPFHGDSRASMSLRKHNRYHCFGCGVKGDTIDLYMRLHDKSFIEAVKALT